MMRDDFYFTVNNKTIQHYFSDNSANNFSIYLEQKLNYYDQYECALVDFSCITEYLDTMAKEILIHFNLYEVQLVSDTQVISWDIQLWTEEDIKLKNLFIHTIWMLGKEIQTHFMCV